MGDSMVPLNCSLRERDAIRVLYSKHTGEWQVTQKFAVSHDNIAAYTTYGTNRANAYHILEDSLNLRSRADFVGQKRIAAVKNMGNGSQLMGLERNTGIDAGKHDMASVILTGPDAVHSIIIICDRRL